jgi:hypothetical protein
MRRMLATLLCAAGLAACGAGSVTSGCMPETCTNGGAPYQKCCDTSHCTYDFTKTRHSCTCDKGDQCDDCAAQLMYYCVNN